MAWPKGRPMSEEQRALRRKPHTEAQRDANRRRMKGRVITWGDKISIAKKGIATSIQKGDKRSPEICAKIKAGFTPESRQKIVATHRGKIIPISHKKAISAFMKKESRRHFMGGKIADYFAEILCPAGFIREYKFFYAQKLYANFQLDFAHVEGKICIELDGKSHDNTQIYDQHRDEILKHFGWRVIRIKL